VVLPIQPRTGESRMRGDKVKVVEAATLPATALMT
jgi:hypothetical protein